MLQAFAENPAFPEIPRQFQKSLGNSRNALVFLNCRGICRKYNNIFDNVQILRNSTASVKKTTSKQNRLS